MECIKSIYQLEKCVAETLLSKLYIGTSLKDGRHVYVVAYRDDFISERLIERLVKVVEDVEGMGHPNFLPFLDYHYDGGAFYVMYEFEENLMALDVYLKNQGKIASQTIRKILTQILDVLLHVSRKGHVYLNLNLDAIYLTKDCTVKLVAPQITGSILAESLVDIPIIEESVFLAPEYLLRQEQSSALDVYGFGVLTYFLYTGHWPYPPHQALIDAKQSLSKPIVPPNQHLKELPDYLSNFILKCLATNPDDRFVSVHEMYVAFHQSKEFSSEQLSPGSHSDLDALDLKESIRSDQQVKRSRIVRSIRALFVPVLIGVAIFMIYGFWTRTVTTVAVPNVVSLPYDDAVHQIQHRGLRVTYGGERFHPTVEKGFVVETKPRAKRDVKANREIKVFVSKGPRTVDVENYVGLDLDFASALPSAKDISFDIVAEEYSIKYDQGMIVSQSVKPNEALGLDEVLEVVVSKGKPVLFSEILNQSPDDDKLQVSLSFWLPEYFEGAKVVLNQRYQGIEYQLFSYYYFPGEKEDVSYWLEPDSDIELYFDDVLVFSRRISK